MATVTGSKDAADALKKSVGDDILKLDPDRMREIAQQLHGKAEELRGLTGGFNEVANTATTEMRQYTTDNQPAPVYSDTLTSITTVSGKYSEQIGKAADKLESDASALQWLADHHEATQDKAKSDIGSVDTSLSASGSAPSPSATKPNNIQTVSSTNPHHADGSDDWFHGDNGYVEPTGPQGAQGHPAAGAGTAPIYG